MKLKLPNVTLIAVAGNKQGETIASMYKSMSKVDFGSVKLVTNIDISASGIEVVKVDGLKSWREYNHFIIKELYKYFTTEYCLIVQWDSWVLNSESWDDDFLKYDIVGAPGLYSDERQNLNGGFSLRSYRLQKAIALDEAIDITSPEDEVLCRLYRLYLEKKYGIKYCPDKLADRFSFELKAPESKTFGFHAFHHDPYKETVVIKRTHSLGDVIMCEAVLEHYHKNGYRVVLDTRTEFEKVYFQHYFPVLLKSQLNPKTQYTEINLDFSYEINPKEPVLKSYFNIAGIKGATLRNSRLNIFSGGNEKLFKKYCLIHIDSTGMPYRDVHGIEWGTVVKYLENNGYQVFQIGRRIDIEIAPYLNTMNLEFMMFLMNGADLFIGSDSGPAQVAVGFDIPSVIFFGSVDPKLRYVDFERIRVVQSDCCKEETKNCYHSQVDVIGKDCIYNKKRPPCVQYTSDMVINAIKSLV